jgi:hypothetical protein
LAICSAGKKHQSQRSLGFRESTFFAAEFTRINADQKQKSALRFGGGLVPCRSRRTLRSRSSGFADQLITAALAVFRNCDRRSLPFFDLGNPARRAQRRTPSLYALISKQMFRGSFVAGCGISGASK